MKRILLAGATVLALTAAQPTLAADAPVYKGPAPYAAAMFSWNGCYIGGNLGGIWGRSRLDIPAYPFPNNIVNSSGWAFGGHIGCNWQSPGSALVLGIEGDASWMDLSGIGLSGNGGTEQFSVNFNWSGSLRGRLGWATGPTLWYFTGGGSWINLNSAQYVPIAAGTRSATFSGWVVGAGVEHAITPNWIIGLEYLYANYGQQNFVYFGPTGFNLQTSTLRGRLSWKF